MKEQSKIITEWNIKDEDLVTRNYLSDKSVNDLDVVVDVLKEIMKYLFYFFFQIFLINY